MNKLLKDFEPPHFPSNKMVYLENGDGVLVAPEVVPVGAAPGAYEKNWILSRTHIYDWRIRAAIESVMSLSRVNFECSTKNIEAMRAHNMVSELHASRLSLPCRSLMPDGPNDNNRALQEFAFEAYDKFDAHFGNQGWSEWYIMPYFQEGDIDVRKIHLGAFVVHNLS